LLVSRFIVLIAWPSLKPTFAYAMLWHVTQCLESKKINRHRSECLLRNVWQHLAMFYERKAPPLT
jgi:hypothetical protein